MYQAIFYWTTGDYGIIPSDRELLRVLDEHRIGHEMKIYDPWLGYKRDGDEYTPLPCVVLRKDGVDVGVLPVSEGMTPVQVQQWILVTVE